MAQKIVTIVGGTGFLGRYVVKLLAASGYTIRVVSPHPEAALHLKTAGDVGQIVLVRGNLADPASLTGTLDNSWAIVNLAGILFERGKQRFTSVHAQGAEILAKMAASCGAQRFVHVSALGVDKPSGSHYARTKLLGEKAVLAAFPAASILRPGVMFGPEDDFFNRFAAMASLLPVVPLIGGGQTRFQPVYVGDVARAVAACLARPDAMGRMYELTGPNSYSMKEIQRYILRIIGKRRPLVPVPFGLAPLMALKCEALGYVLGRRPLLTRDQVKLLKWDNLASPNALTLSSLGIAPTAVEVIVPGYLARFNKATALQSGFDKLAA